MASEPIGSGRETTRRRVSSQFRFGSRAGCCHRAALRPDCPAMVSGVASNAQFGIPRLTGRTHPGHLRQLLLIIGYATMATSCAATSDAPSRTEPNGSDGSASSVLVKHSDQEILAAQLRFRAIPNDPPLASLWFKQRGDALNNRILVEIVDGKLTEDLERKFAQLLHLSMSRSTSSNASLNRPNSSLRS